MVSPIVCSERKNFPDSIQTRPHLPKRDEHVCKSLDWQVRPHTRPGVRDIFEQIRGESPSYDQRIPISETQDIEIKWTKR